MADKGKNLLMKFKQSETSYPPLEKEVLTPHLEEAKKGYEAIVETKRGNRMSRFKIVASGGVSYGCSYAHLIDWVYTYPNEIIITTSSRIFFIEGKNLDNVERLLIEERIKEIHQFDKKIHTPLIAGDDKPLIELIKVE